MLFAFFYLPVTYWYGWGLEPGTGLDFPSYYYGARFAFVHHVTPYGQHAFDYLPGVAGDHVQPYIYPPPSLLIFWPLAYLPLEVARNAFRVLNHCFYLGSVVLLLRLLPVAAGRSYLATALCLIYFLNFDPAFATLFIGQINLLVLLLLCLALSALRNNSAAWKIALPLSVAILIKTYPALLLVVLLFRKKFTDVTLTTAFLAVFTIVSYSVLPGDVWSSWVTAALPAGGYANDVIHAGFAFNQSLNAFVMRLFMENYFSKAPLLYPALAKPVCFLLAALVAGVTLFSSFCLHRQEHSERKGDEEIAAYLLMTYLIAPISWDHHLVNVLPAAVLAIGLLATRRIPPAQTVMVIFALCLIAWKLPIGSRNITNGWWTLLISVKLYPVVALWAFFIARMRSGSQSASTFLPA